MADDSWWLDISELDDEQRSVIDLPDDGSYLFIGPPGSGKTNLLLLRASYLIAAQKPNVVVLMFTRSLREFVTLGAEHYRVSGSKIMTIMKWAQTLLREHGVPIDDLPDEFEKLRLEVANRLKALIDRRPALERHLECILVDEVQDCLSEEIELFFRCARNVFFVGDDRQRIYRVDGIIEDISKRVDTRRLIHHYRNGREICKVADAIGKTSGEL
ncbi:MAG: helicase, partial [bacterium]|nr:helicase [bacterium]